MTKNKKAILTISILSIVVALLIVLMVVLNSLGVISIFSDGEDNKKLGPPTNLEEGEGYYLSKITLYPQIPKKSVVGIDIVNHKTGVTTSITSKEGDEKLYLKGYEDVFKVKDSVYSFLISAATRALTTESDSNLPIRNCTEEQMKTYGLTEDTCEISYTVKYIDDDGKEQEKTVYVGYETFKTDNSRYVALKGRDSAYTMLNLETIVGITPEKCINPIIYSRYTESTVATSIKGLLIRHGEKDVIKLRNTTSLGVAYGSAVYTLEYPVKTLADSDYVLGVITTLYTNFSGDEVVSIKPDKATLEKYGFGDTNHIYAITGAHASGDESVFFISELQEDGYYYLRSQLYLEFDIDLIIRIPKGILYFLEEDQEKLVKWAATNTPLSGFYKYLHPDKESDQSGVKQIIIKTKTFEETFYISTEEKEVDGNRRIYISVTSKSGKYTFIDDYSHFTSNDTSSSYKINQFRNFYTYLVNFPMPIRFCNLTTDEIEATKTEENFMFELTVATNDGQAEKYTYYANQKAPGYVIREESVGTYDGEGYHFGESNVIFDVTREHLLRVTKALDKLIKGEFIDPRDDLY